MGYYLFFSATLGLLLYRFFRARRTGERTVLTALFLFLLLTAGVHAWLVKVSSLLTFLEGSALGVTLVWLGGGPFFSWLEKKNEERNIFQRLRARRGPLFEIVEAARALASAGQGALIAIERKAPLEKWIRSGVRLDAAIRRETIFSIFTPPGALHDGGLIVAEGRMASAGVIFPLTKRTDIPTELGTRHRAALGMSEATDALVVVVSEETGKISIADRGGLVYGVKPEKLPELLESSLKSRGTKRLGLPLSSPEPALR